MMRWFFSDGSHFVDKKMCTCLFVFSPGDLFMFSACMSNLFPLSIFHTLLFGHFGGLV